MGSSRLVLASAAAMRLHQVGVAPAIRACSALAPRSPGALCVYDGASWRSWVVAAEIALHGPSTAPQTLSDNPFDILALNVSWSTDPMAISPDRLTLPVPVTNSHTAAVSSFWAITNQTPAHGAAKRPKARAGHDEFVDHVVARDKRYPGPSIGVCGSWAPGSTT